MKKISWERKKSTIMLNYFTVKKSVADSKNAVSVISIEQNDKEENRIVVGSKKR